VGRSYIQQEGDLFQVVPAPDARPSADWLDAAAFERAATTALAVQDVAVSFV
jgi:hypothetical protein